jgi:ubiquinol-cytochrome c reductase cytochrome c1 subunit
VIKRQLFVFIGLLLSVMSLIAASVPSEGKLHPAGTFFPFAERKEVLQRGAKLFINYCAGCHSLRYLHYHRMAVDLGLSNDLLVNNLIFTGAKIDEPIRNSMPAAKAKKWFGVAPPDLSLVARERGAAWIYTYLKSFYADDSRPFGTNNRLAPGVAMPNVLAVDKGEMSQQQFEQTLEDLVSFLVYVGEPAKLLRYRMGIKVIIFLSLFLIVVYQLKKLYWIKL